MYGNHQHGHGHAPNHARLPQDPYKAYNQYQQPAHGSNYGGPHNQFGGYGQQNQHTPAPYHGANWWFWQVVVSVPLFCRVEAVSCHGVELQVNQLEPVKYVSVGTAQTGMLWL